jgi:uncharacterized membrane protein YkgB
MTDYIKHYYQSERNMALLAVGIGVVFLFIGWSTLRQPGSAHLNRGFAYTMLVWGVLSLMGLGMVFQSNQKMAQATTYSQPNLQLQQTELRRIETVLATGYRVSTLMALGMILLGLALLLFSPGSPLRGIGLGILVMGTTLHAIDFLSTNKHKAYYQAVKQLKF